MIFGRLISLLLLLLLIFSMSVNVQASELDVDEYKEVQAVEILEQIRNGEDVNLSKCRIVGVVSLEMIEIPETVPNNRKVTSVPSEKTLKVVESRIIIQDSIFEDYVDFSGVFFRNSVSFEGTHFSSKSDFTSVDFNNIADFRGAFFNDTVYFLGTDFIGNAYFGGARGVSYESIGSILSPGSGTVFSENAEFRQARFWNEAHFEFASFNEANFVDSNFENAYFISSNVYGETHFEGSNFNNTAYFCSSTFDNIAEFRSSSFKNAYICNSKFREINFLDAKFKTISLNDTSFERIKVRWGFLENSLVFDGQTYVKLIQNFRNLEQFEDADAAYFQYRKRCQAKNPWISFPEKSPWISFPKVGDIFMWFSCGYGVKPSYTVGSSIFVILLFSAIYLWEDLRSKGLREFFGRRFSEFSGIISRLRMSRGRNILNLSSWVFYLRALFHWRAWDAFYFSIASFTNSSYDDWKPEKHGRKLAVFEGFIGNLFIALFIVTLVNVLIRP